MRSGYTLGAQQLLAHTYHESLPDVTLRAVKAGPMVSGHDLDAHQDGVYGRPHTGSAIHQELLNASARGGNMELYTPTCLMGAAKQGTSLRKQRLPAY